jgi:uncharacterized hydrophobic protein (TIGR00271 family)
MGAAMLQLRVYGRTDALTALGNELERDGTARHLGVTPGLRAGGGVLTGVVAPTAADAVLDQLTAGGIPAQDIALTRSDDIGPLAAAGSAVDFIWADVLGQATRHSRPVARFLVFMVTAGVIAGFGVIEVNQILIVGAMAVSPDAMPIAAVCIALVGRRARLAVRATTTLVVGLSAAAAAACALTAVLDLLGLLPASFEVGEAALSGLTSVNATTIGVAAAAGVAGMLALETRASAGVGVAISVTTIPAAAYLGVAASVGEVDKASGALAVLAVNVVMIQVGGAATLLVQRRLTRRRRPTVQGLDSA